MTDITVRVKEDEILLIRNNEPIMIIDREAYEKHKDIRKLLNVFFVDMILAEVKKHRYSIKEEQKR